ncbi:MAG: L-2-hydroxyglutarate oxidase [Myxococcales bacterium]|nr:L-2-hydroxyglutarate oxidase [Myxococcales bacterium]
MDKADLVVVGGGIVGLGAARAWIRRHPESRVIVLEKEAAPGAHASGRNSGVLHAGFYYDADSLKAELSVRGNAAMRAFCEERGLPIRVCGKLVVTRSEAEIPRVDQLLARGLANGVRVVGVDAAEARRIEPRARTVERALWSPDTAVVSPGAVMSALAAELRDSGVEIRVGSSLTGRAGGRILATTTGPLRAERVLNAAGVHADRVAASWDVGTGLQLVPFRGSYVMGEGAGPLACCVYPVPDPTVPFLGVHVTVTPDGGVKLGPTASPARWREDYGGRANFSLEEAREQARVQLRLALREGSFRRHAIRELLHHSRTWVVREASSLVEGLRRARFRTWGRPGIRAQLVDRRTGRFVTDFVVEDGERSVHVLNAVSPAFTCSLPFGELLADRLEGVA